MRDFLDSILLFLTLPTLNDGEFNAIELTEQDYGLATYEALKALLVSRGSSFKDRKRLKDFFEAKGLDLRGDKVAKPKSNIFIGAPL